MYGGTVQPWSDPKAAPDQFEVITETNELRIWLPPDEQGLSQHYERWSGGGCTHRCDGEQCVTTRRDGDDYIEETVPCVCVAQNDRKCELKTRLSVILPDVPLGGVWRVDTKSELAAEELPAMAELISQSQASGLVPGRLVVEQRIGRGGAREYIVVGLKMAATAAELEAGVTHRHELAEASTSAPALGPGSPQGEPDPPKAVQSAPWEVDDEIADAEIVEEGADVGDVFDLPNAPRDQVELTADQVAALLDGRAKWSEHTEGRVVKA